MAKESFSNGGHFKGVPLYCVGEAYTTKLTSKFWICILCINQSNMLYSNRHGRKREKKGKHATDPTRAKLELANRGP